KKDNAFFLMMASLYQSGLIFEPLSCRHILRGQAVATQRPTKNQQSMTITPIARSHATKQSRESRPVGAYGDTPSPKP
ncbi:MAG: hypothetical protein Q7R68_02115, partial [Nitrospirales bacterium]|nr:hypothetical protein [Nitrospirales bacterium]